MCSVCVCVCACMFTSHSIKHICLPCERTATISLLLVLVSPFYSAWGLSTLFMPSTQAISFRYKLVISVCVCVCCSRCGKHSHLISQSCIELYFKAYFQAVKQQEKRWAKTRKSCSGYRGFRGHKFVIFDSVQMSQLILQNVKNYTLTS